MTKIAPLGISMGCPAGIGPEIILKALATRRDRWGIPPVVVLGDYGILKKTSKLLELNIPIFAWRPGDELPRGGIALYPLTSLDPEAVPWGEPSPRTGAAAYSYITAGVGLCMEGTLSGLVTAPISKTGLRLANIPYPGHTEILAHETGTKRYAMMLAGRKLRVILVTIHCPLHDVANRLTTDGILETIRLGHEALTRDFGIEKPAIAVAGLNPHAGENGMFGDEESRIIEPAVLQARTEGIGASGPYPPDTVFYNAVYGRFDAVVCQYHDQGLIPLKLLHFMDGVNVTLGLPIVRTSVDHGTAYDIAGTGRADSLSLEAAISLAADIAATRFRHSHETDRR